MFFKKITNKKRFIKFNVIEFFQILLIKIYNRLLNLFLLIGKSENNYPKSRDKILFSSVKSILEYAINNNIDINHLKIGLDEDSKNSLDKIFRNLYYVFTHSLIDYTSLFSSTDIAKINSIKKYTSSLKDHIKLSINHYEIIVFYYHCGLKYLPKHILNDLEGKDIIDGGAYIGDSALLFDKYYKPNKIYAFEPEINNYNHLVQTIKINSLSNVFPLQLGLGEKNEILNIKKGGKGSFISNSGDYKVEITSIDEFVSKNKLSLGLIKLDVEGFCFKVLKGAIKTIKEFKPILLIAIYHNGEEFFETLKFINKIKLGYHYVIRLPPHSLIDETLLVAWVE